MIDWLVYLLTGGFAGFLLAFVIALFKVGPGKPEFNFPKATIICCALTLGGPFGFTELQTAIHRKQMEPIVRAWYDETDMIVAEDDHSGLQYWKVLAVTKDKAWIIVVGKEWSVGDFYDRPVVRLALRKGKSGKWFIDEETTEVLRSDRLNKDSFVWPPFQ